jgi:hypothetical protein
MGFAFGGMEKNCYSLSPEQATAALSHRSSLNSQERSLQKSDLRFT